VILQTESDAWALLCNHKFVSSWQELFDACPWTTTFQSPGFVCTWFEHYQSQFSPVLIYQATGERLTALLILGQSISAHKLVIAGGYQAEYQAWLERPDEQGNFIQQALETVATSLPGYNLAFKYLPDQAPIEHIKTTGKLTRRIRVTPQPRLYIHLSQESVNQIFSSKRNQRSLKQLTKSGELKFTRITDPRLLDTIFDEIIAFYDFRQGAVHDRFPFLRDAAKKPFHLDLLTKCPELLHVTVTTLDGKILAAHIGIVSNKQVHLGIITYSPFYGHYSPGIVHLMLLCQHLHREGFTNFDLTPGTDPAKERFANQCDQVSIFTLYRGWQACLIATLKAKGVDTLKSLSRLMGLSHERSQALYERAKRFDLGKAGRALSRFIWEKSEVRVYHYTRERSASNSGCGPFNKDRLQDLILYEPSGRPPSKQTFMLEATKRLGRNGHFYTYVVAGRLVFCCWLSVQQNEHFIPQVRQTFQLRERSAVLEHFYCDPEHLRADLLLNTMEHILFDASESSSDKRVYIFVHDHDDLVANAFEKLGLEYVGSLHLQRAFGVTSKW
jgi:CelD/BcsL family acetyltransferase involved in cellulose biosynthesis